ncbi:hypothetical protein EJ06DRAFT_557519 [Trichodelitschia bisporula]|uniref:Uncharacterized protein n=1 Tax=Trichodelitschia bisporula TaxID=703511 RepID=A0A6G1HSF3_9PEZI|nr:hypothetical protein EJ06DRAFT_557519 [Trichodelitschia bisporula]
MPGHSFDPLPVSEGEEKIVRELHTLWGWDQEPFLSVARNGQRLVDYWMDEELKNVVRIPSADHDMSMKCREALFSAFMVLTGADPVEWLENLRLDKDDEHDFEGWMRQRRHQVGHNLEMAAFNEPCVEPESTPEYLEGILRSFLVITGPDADPEPMLQKYREGKLDFRDVVDERVREVLPEGDNMDDWMRCMIPEEDGETDWMSEGERKVFEKREGGEGGAGGEAEGVEGECA